MTSKFRQQDWHQLPRRTRLAMTMYPNLAPADRQAEMLRLAEAEGKRAGLEKRMGRTVPKAK